jgi:alkaline phosphatase D
MPEPFSRRTFLGATAVGAAALVARPMMGRTQAGVAPFLHGVASGDPLADRAIIWTRVTPSPDAVPGSGIGPPVDVTWQVAADPGFSQVVKSGVVTTTAAHDHTVHVDVTGLRAGADHWYRFTALGTTSPVGRTRTAPAAGTALDALRIGVVTCSEYEFGYFGAYRHLAARDDVDVVLHLGDFIYEFGIGYGHPPTVADTPGPEIGRSHEPPNEIVTLGDYRTRYAQYRRDADSQALHAAHPVVVMWDDHEFANDAWSNGSENHQPEEGDWAARAAAARQAWREWQPVRQAGDDAEAVYRSFRFGDMAEVWMLDERRYRSQQPQNAFLSYGSVDPAINDPSRTMLGTTQHDWFLGGLTTSTAAWKVLGNPVMFMPFVMGPPLMAALVGALGPVLPAGLPLPPPLTVDDWNGYNAERQAILTALADSAVKDVVVLTGDYHESFAADLPDAIDGYVLDDNSAGVEFIVPSVTSPGLAETLEAGGLPNGDAVNVVFEANITANNPWIKYHEGHSNGFAVIELTAERAQLDFIFLADRLDPATTATVQASWLARRGNPHVEPASGPLPTRVRAANQIAPAPAPAPAARGQLPPTGGPALPVAALAAGAAALAARRALDAS